MVLQEVLFGGLEGEAADEARRALLRGAGLLDTPPGADIDRWIAALRRRTGAPAAALRLLGEPGLVRPYAAAGQGIDPGEAAGAEADPCLAHLLELLAGGGARIDAEGVLEAPVTVDGYELGTVAVVDPGRRTWTAEDLQAIDDAASAVSTEVALRLAKREAGRAQQLVVSHAKVHDLIAGAAPLREILVAVAESVERHDPSVLACVVLLDPASSTLHPGAGPSLPPSYLAAIDGVVIGPNVGTCGTAAWSGELTITEDIASDPRWAPVCHVAEAAGLAHCWSMPIKAPGGEVLGTLAFYGRRARRPLPEQLGLLRDWARVAGIAIERHRALERLVHEARHDSLTGLANRVATMEALEEAVRRASRERPVAVLFVDLDGLKQLNDTLGHDRADEMIREVSARLAATVPPGCTVGRFGGDEFVIVAEGLSGRGDAGALAVRLLEEVAKPLPGSDALVVTASIGIAIAADDALDAREVLREADSAMYAAKRSGRDRCTFYDGGQRVRSGRRVGLQQALRGAETRGELHLAYQPVVSLSSSQIVGVEAVPVWESPSFGRVTAAELVEIAEGLGTVVPLGAWLLRESCETVAALCKELGRPLDLGVDVSLRQLENPGFTLAVRQVLAHTGLAAAQLGLEIGEAELARPGTVALHALDELANLGVRLVLDDAGAALCGPSRLKGLPLNAAKIDRQITECLPGDAIDEAIASAVIDVGTAFGLCVAAQGIDREEQRALLEALGCDEGQGDLFSPALTADALARLLRGGSAE